MSSMNAIIVLILMADTLYFEWSPRTRTCLIVGSGKTSIRSSTHFRKSISVQRRFVGHLTFQSSTYDTLTAVMLTNRTAREYMINYSRSLIYTTAPTFATVIAINTSHDFLLANFSESVRCLFLSE